MTSPSYLTGPDPKGDIAGTGVFSEGDLRLDRMATLLWEARQRWPEVCAAVRAGHLRLIVSDPEHFIQKDPECLGTLAYVDRTARWAVLRGERDTARFVDLAKDDSATVCQRASELWGAVP